MRLRFLHTMSLAVSFIGVTTCFAQTVANPHICGMPNGQNLTTLQDSLDEASQISPVLAAALNDLVSFPDMQNFVTNVRPAKVCITAIAVSRNIYQYDEFLTVVNMTSNDGTERVLPLMFQASSIQAHDNTGPKPWLGFSRATFTNTVKSLIAKVTFTDQPNKDVDDFSPMQFLSQVLQLPTLEQPLDSGSQSYVLIPGVDANWTTYLVSQLRTLQTGNPFTSQDLLDVGVVQIQAKTGKLRTAAMPSLFSDLTKFEELQDKARPAQNTDAAHLQTLLKLSR